MSPAAQRVLGVAGLLVVLQLVLRTWVAARGNFYWDDLILTGRSGSLPLLSTDFLLYDHDGHFMPAAFVLAKLITTVAPLQWIGPVISLAVLQALASLSVLRLLRLVMGERLALLGPLAFYLFSPLTLPSFAWWAAALNDLPMQMGLAWVAGDAIQLVRTGNRRYALTGVLVFATALAFFEKAVVVPWFAFCVVALVLHTQGQRAVIRTVARRGAPLWRGAMYVTGAWILLYTSIVTSHAAQYSVGQALTLTWRGFIFGFVPSLLGGPWSWNQVQSSIPWADPPNVLVALSLLALVGTVVLTLRLKAHVGGVWLLVAGYVGGCMVVMVLARSGPYTAPALGQSLRYVADSAVVVAVGTALILCAPNRSPKAPVQRPVRWVRARAVAGIGVAVAFLVSSLVSTLTFTRAWSHTPTAAYLATAEASMAANRGAPLLDQPVSDRILWKLANPYNLASRIFSPLGDKVVFASSTSVLRHLDDSGHVVPAQMSIKRSAAPGPIRRCGYNVTDAGFTSMPLNGPLIQWGWTVDFWYLTGEAGSLEVEFETGQPVIVPVSSGLNQVFVSVVGRGEALRVRSHTPAMVACVNGAVVGLVDDPSPQP